MTDGFGQITVTQPTPNPMLDELDDAGDDAITNSN